LVIGRVNVTAKNTGPRHGTRVNSTSRYQNQRYQNPRYHKTNKPVSQSSFVR
jgi:hypothetical protein